MVVINLHSANMGAARITAFFLLFTTVLAQKALDEYVKRPDPNYKYEKLSETVDVENNARILTYNLTSLRWRTDAEVSQSLWWHYLVIVIPTEVRYPNHSGIFIGLGDNTDDPPTVEDDFILAYLVQMAHELKAVIGYLTQIPNQPIVFADDPLQESRKEDDIIGYTWKKFMVDSNTTDPEILLLFPMVKATVKAMDAVQAITKTEENMNIEKFMLLGPSKRGWTTWLTAAVDSRVFCIAPQVFSIMNTMKNLHQHFRALGGWTWAFKPYWRNNITRYIDAPQGAALAYHLDPLEYRERLTMPKLMISSSGDEFFLNQDTHVWWANMTEPKYMMMLDNAGHEMFPHYEEIYANIKAFFRSSVAKSKTPTLTWERTQTATGGKIRFTTDVAPTEIRYYESTTTGGKRRDWRTIYLAPNGTELLADLEWTSGDVNDLGNGVYEVEVAKPAVGWVAFFIEAKFKSVEGETFQFSSEVNISPDTFYYPDCTGAGCDGQLR